MKPTQSEFQLEEALLKHLSTMGYQRVSLPNTKALIANFRLQLERHNKLTLTDAQFESVLNQMDRGSLFDRAQRLRSTLAVEDEHGQAVYLQLFNTKHWCRNTFQVTHQVTNRTEQNHSRYDVTVLINGLPLVQIELKKSSVGVREAFDQIVRYRATSYSQNRGLFQYIQLFIISNGVNTRYFSNNKKLSFPFTFEWADENNQPINALYDFTEAFMEKCHLAKMIARYTVLNETTKQLMILRPYQYYAVERILARVESGVDDGHIWHTTGSGKTMTSFKSSQILSRDARVHKVLFVVDRRDLDKQTAQEFNSFSSGSVSPIDNTKALVEQLLDPETALIVTTLQKLNHAISRPQYADQLKALRGLNVVLIFDECHRSQFGETHQKICAFFHQRQMFGFTGTPILPENSSDSRTTEDLFGKTLHRYLITNAIRDKNVLPFSMEYRALTNRQDYSSANRTASGYPINPGTDPATVDLSNPARLKAIAEDIVAIHDHKTHHRQYNAMFCVANVDTLQDYYHLLQNANQSLEKPLRIATIFSCNAEAPSEFNGVSDEDLPNMDAGNVDTSRKAFLQDCVDEYNGLFGCAHSVNDNQSFYKYYDDVARKVREGKVDILIVVNMFLTGFDAQGLNTLYVDKNLKHHGLIQAYSRTNRVFDEQKTHGNIVCYRDLKEATDESLAIFASGSWGHSREDVLNTVIMMPYEEMAETFVLNVKTLRRIAPTPQSVDLLIGEKDQLAFLHAYRDILRLQTTMKTFHDFFLDMENNRFEITLQELQDYQGKYLDLSDRIKAAEEARQAEATEHGDDAEPEEADDDTEQLVHFDFEIGLIKQDEVNVDYILGLIGELPDDKDTKEYRNKRQFIIDVLRSDPDLRHKTKLIERFIDSQEQQTDDTFGEDSVTEQFHAFADRELQRAITDFCETEHLDAPKFLAALGDFRSRGRLPTQKESVDLVQPGHKPRLLERGKAHERIKDGMHQLKAVYGL